MPPTLQADELRRNSRIRREVRDGVPVYIKQPLVQDWEASAEQVRQRSEREADVIRRIACSGRFGGRLGTVALIDCQPADAIVVTREVSGRPLQEFLVGSYRRSPDRDCMRALLLTGRWLNAFQKLSVQDRDYAVIGDQSPGDLIEYCDIRLRKLNSLGYSGLTRDAQRRLLKSVETYIAQSSLQDQALVLCHGDFGAFNVLWDSHVLTAIDFSQAHSGVPLLDVTYFIHRMSMLDIYFPWKRWPVAHWREAFLMGYGRPLALKAPMYHALMIRHLLCRLQTYVRRPRPRFRDKLHTRWVIRRVRDRLLHLVNADPNQSCTENN